MRDDDPRLCDFCQEWQVSGSVMRETAWARSLCEECYERYVREPRRKGAAPRSGARAAPVVDYVCWLITLAFVFVAGVVGGRVLDEVFGG